MLCLADRGFSGFDLWHQAQATGAQLLWRCGSTWQLPPHRVLDGGSFLSSIRRTGVGRVQAAEQAITVRVIEYALPGMFTSGVVRPQGRELTPLSRELPCVAASHAPSGHTPLA